MGAASVKEGRVLVLGLDNAGKTTILKKLAEEDITHVMPTQGFNMKSLTKGKLNLKMWDLGGQRAIRPYWRSYFEKTDAIVYVFDSADRQRLEETGGELRKILQEDKLMGVPLLAFANKQDLLNAMSADEIVKALDLQLIKDRSFQVIACSAKTEEGLQEGIQWIFDIIGQAKK